MPDAFQKEMVDAIECMSEYGDVGKCNHYLEAFYKKSHAEEDPAPGKFTKFVTAPAATAGPLGTVVGLGLAMVSRVYMLYEKT